MAVNRYNIGEHRSRVKENMILSLGTSAVEITDTIIRDNSRLNKSRKKRLSSTREARLIKKTRTTNKEYSSGLLL